MNAQLDDEIGELAGHLHAATAQFVDLATELDGSLQWDGFGMRSCAHWVTIATGIDLSTAREMLRVGHALCDLPLIHDAFAAGQLSFDKVRSLTHVATSADEHVWLDVALEASGSQLSRICREFRRTIAMDDPSRSALQRARRRLVSWWLDEDGMLALYAALPPEEGRLVLAAIESAVVRPVSDAGDAGEAVPAEVGAGSVEAAVNDPCEEDPPDHPHGALRADALVRICEGWLADVRRTSPSGITAELVVHVDSETLSGADPGGRCHIEDGPAVSTAVARRIACDGSVVIVREREGIPVEIGESRRTVTGRTRRLLQLRDRGCRYPGCTVPASGTEGHHVIHREDHGRTRLTNLVSLCRFHHHRHHEGAFEIVSVRDGSPGQRRAFSFQTSDGRAIRPRRTGTTPSAAAGARWLRSRWSHPSPITPDTPAARDRGRAFDLDHAIVVLSSNVRNARRRTGDQPAGP